MKKILTFVFVGLLVCSGAWAAQVTINATATQVLSVETGNATWSVTLDNSGADLTVSPVDNLTVKSSKHAYTVTFSSSDAGQLKMTSESDSYYIPYLIKVDTAGWVSGVSTNNLSDYIQLTTAKIIVFNARTPVAGKSFPIGFKINEYADYYENGLYSATLTIGISAN